MTYEIVNKEVYGLKEAAALCCMAQDDMKSLAERRGLDLFQVQGGHWRIRKNSLKNFMEQCRIQAPKCWDGELQKLKVLVVEDDYDLLEIVSELLKDENRIQVRAEKNGFNAELQVAGWHPDLILLDFLMPGITGFELCHRLKVDQKTTDIPILAMTSLTSDKNKESVLHAGVSDFIGKPFYSENLLAKVRTLLGLE